MSRLILDAMGGDTAPLAALEGAALALPELAREMGELLGDESVPRSRNLTRNLPRNLHGALERGPMEGTVYRVGLRHAPQNIDMEDSIRAIRSKPNAEIDVGRQLAGQAHAHLGRLPGGEHPAIAVKLPTLRRDVIDVRVEAAPLLGVAGYVPICHGRSDSKAIKNAPKAASLTWRQPFGRALKEGPQKEGDVTL